MSERETLVDTEFTRVSEHLTRIESKLDELHVIASGTLERVSHVPDELADDVTDVDKPTEIDTTSTEPPTEPEIKKRRRYGRWV